MAVVRGAVWCVLKLKTLTAVSRDLHSQPVGPAAVASSRLAFVFSSLVTPEIYTKKEKSAYPFLAHGQGTEANRGVPRGHRYFKLLFPFRVSSL